MTAYAEIPLTGAVRRAVGREWDGAADACAAAERLHGGEESTAYRLGAHVVRIGPTWRGSDDAEWCHAIAAHAATTLPEAVAPLRTRGGASVVRVDGRPVSLWPHVEGAWPPDSQRLAAQAARLLARLHRALAGLRPDPRPTPSALALERVGAPGQGGPADPGLDRWLTAFRRPEQPLHGDFYAGNTLVRDGRIVAVLDWDEALVGPPELELASAALEWTDDCADDLAPLRRFVAGYHAAGGTAGPLDDEALVQLIRHRLRREAAWFEAAARRGATLDAEDRDYHERRLAAFHRLRP